MGANSRSVKMLKREQGAGSREQVYAFAPPAPRSLLPAPSVAEFAGLPADEQWPCQLEPPGYDDDPPTHFYVRYGGHRAIVEINTTVVRSC